MSIEKRFWFWTGFGQGFGQLSKTSNYPIAQHCPNPNPNPNNPNPNSNQVWESRDLTLMRAGIILTPRSRDCDNPKGLGLRRPGAVGVTLISLHHGTSTQLTQGR